MDCPNRSESFCVVSVNLSNSEELIDFYLKENKVMGKNFLTSSDKNVQALGQILLDFQGTEQELPKVLSESQFKIIKDYVSLEYQLNITKLFKGMNEMNDKLCIPDLYCLQELNLQPKPSGEESEQTCLLKVFQAEFELVNRSQESISRDSAIAFRKDRFQLVGAQKTKEDGLIVDLRLRSNQKIIRVVSDHIFAIPSTQYLQGHYDLAKRGDDQLRATIQKAGEVTSLGVLASLWQNPWGDKFFPEAIIFGMDANATLENDPHPLHPDRLKILMEAGYKMDKEKATPTHIDPITGHMRRFDHIAVKTSHPCEINNLVCFIRDLNPQIAMYRPLFGEEAVKRLRESVTDHLPVVAKITVHFL